MQLLYHMLFTQEEQNEGQNNEEITDIDETLSLQ